MASALVGLAAWPAVSHRLTVRSVAQRAETMARRQVDSGAPLDVAVALRVEQLGPMLASWETVGGCGAGGTGGGAGVGVKWIGRSTTGGLFQLISQANYVKFADGYNLIASTQVSRELSPKWHLGVFVPYVYKMYYSYRNLPVDVSNSGFGDVNALITRKFGPINATSLTLAVGLPTGTNNAIYKNDPLTQEKQLGLGKFGGSLIFDHTMDETWGLIVLGGLFAYRGGENQYGNYRAPSGSLYGYTGYFMGPLVPVVGVSLTHFFGADRDRGQRQDLPLTLVAANASIEWSNDLVAVLAGVSVPYSIRGTTPEADQPIPTRVTGLMPWIAAIGVSVSPF